MAYVDCLLLQRKADLPRSKLLAGGARPELVVELIKQYHGAPIYKTDIRRVTLIERRQERLIIKHRVTIESAGGAKRAGAARTNSQS